MSENEPWESDLLKERSLTQVFVGSRQLNKSSFNTRTRLVIAIGAIAYVVTNCAWGADNKPILDAIVRASAIVIGVAATVLGFLIAGFSIFASMADKSLFKILAQTPHTGTNLSELKYVFFNFINVFSVYFILLVISGLLLFAAPLGPLTPLNEVVVLSPTFIVGLNSAILAAFVFICVEAAIRLKSFIWSFYQSVLIAIILAPDEPKPADCVSKNKKEELPPDQKGARGRSSKTSAN